jgi:hypothetical protein
MQDALGQHIVLIFDPGTSVEFPVSFLTPELARQLGEHLVEVATAVASSQQTEPHSRN